MVPRSNSIQKSYCSDAPILNFPNGASSVTCTCTIEAPQIYWVTEIGTTLGTPLMGVSFPFTEISSEFVHMCGEFLEYHNIWYSKNSPIWTADTMYGEISDTVQWVRLSIPVDRPQKFTRVLNVDPQSVGPSGGHSMAHERVVLPILLPPETAPSHHAELTMQGISEENSC